MDRKYIAALIAALAGGYGLGEMDLAEAQAQPRMVNAEVVVATSTVDELLMGVCEKIDVDNCTPSLLTEAIRGHAGLQWTDTDGDGHNEWVLDMSVRVVD